MAKTFQNAKGFSLVEVMVVVSILGVLVAIAIPNFQRFTEKAKQSEARSVLSAIYSAERAFHSEWQSFFADFRNIGYQPSGNVRYRHGFSGAGVGCPGGYQGAGVAGGGAATNFSTTTFCSVGGECTEILVPVNPGTLSGATTGVTTFTAQARGDIDGDPFIDVWQITEAKVITLVADDKAN